MSLVMLEDIQLAVVRDNEETCLARKKFAVIVDAFITGHCGMLWSQLFEIWLPFELTQYTMTSVIKDTVVSVTKMKNVMMWVGWTSAYNHTDWSASFCCHVIRNLS